jgi:hypothetical protein
MVVYNLVKVPSSNTFPIDSKKLIGCEDWMEG